MSSIPIPSTSPDIEMIFKVISVKYISTTPTITHEESCRVMHRKASHSFPISRVYQAHIPTCSSGYWLFGFASKNITR